MKPFFPASPRAAAALIVLLSAVALLSTGCFGPQVSGLDSTFTGGGAAPSSPATSVGGDRTDAGSDGCVAPTSASDWRARVLQLVNAERTQRGLSPLTRNATLEAQANQYACEMITYEFFDHVNPVTGSTLPDRARQFSYEYQTIGENLAAGQSSPEQVMEDWMNSDGHRANILHPDFMEIGIGIRESTNQYRYYWVQEFGRPLSAAVRR